jgi:hypothetical protein
MLTSMEKYLFVTVNYATEVPGDALPKYDPPRNYNRKFKKACVVQNTILPIKLQRVGYNYNLVINKHQLVASCWSSTATI